MKLIYYYIIFDKIPLENCNLRSQHAIHDVAWRILKYTNNMI